MLPCPAPQITEQNVVKVPCLSAVNSIVTGFPGSSLSLMPYSGIEMPWGTSTLVTISLTLSPLLTSIVSGTNENCFAVILNSLTSLLGSVFSTACTLPVGACCFVSCCCGTGVPPPTKSSGLSSGFCCVQALTKNTLNTN